MKRLLAIIEMGGYPNFMPLYQSLGFSVEVVNSMRKARSALKKETPDVIVAEYNFQSQFRDRTSNLETLMAGLSCGEVSLNAWEILERGADDFLTLGEDAVAACMRLLAANEPPIEAGESAVAGLGALIVAMQNPEDRNALGLDAASRVFVIGTEGATDPDLYRQLVGDFE